MHRTDQGCEQDNVTFTDPLPGVDPNTDDSITGADILDVVDKFLAQYVIYPNEHMRHAHVLWIVHTHFMELVGVHAEDLLQIARTK